MSPGCLDEEVREVAVVDDVASTSQQFVPLRTEANHLPGAARCRERVVSDAPDEFEVGASTQELIGDSCRAVSGGPAEEGLEHHHRQPLGVARSGVVHDLEPSLSARIALVASQGRGNAEHASIASYAQPPLVRPGPVRCCRTLEEVAGADDPDAVILGHKPVAVLGKIGQAELPGV